ncbi:MAG: CehA/McbA family metallohydrolase [Pseudomonadota bacterium]
MLETFSAPGSFFRGNLHGHSTNSDGRLDPAEVCARYQHEGYDFIALTDHFRPNYNFPITDTTAYRTATFTTILGAEVHAPQTSRGEEWHILAVGLPADFPATRADETGPSLARRCAEAGAFVAIAHPHWYQLTLEDARTIDAAHAIEAYNHTSELHCARGGGEEMWDALLLEGRRLNGIAVDDSHFHDADAFGGWVMVKAAHNDPDALLAALKAGHFYATQGPTIASVEREGDDLVITSSPAKSVALVGPVTLSERATGTAITRARLPLTKFAGQWCRAIITDASGAKAWTNPLWLTA